MGSTTDTGSPAGSAESKNGAGAPKDAAQAFLKAAVAWPKGPEPDPNAATAFELGWLTRTLQLGVSDRSEVLLGGTGAALNGAAGWPALRRRIPTLIARIKQRLEKKDESPDELARLGAHALGDANADARTLADEAGRLHEETLASLFVLDAALADAYTLGRNLRDLRPSPAAGEGIDAVAARVEAYGAPVSEALGRLASKLAPNAAHSIRHSLALWESEIARLRDAIAGNGPAAPLDAAHVPEQLRAQIEIWRSLLKGDVAARDLLRASDYLGTVENVMEQFAKVAGTSLRRPRMLGLALCVVALLVLTVVLFVLDKDGSIVAGLGTFLAAIGLTWKGIGEFFGRAAAKGEQALWDAQLDWTIAYRCTLRPEGAWPPKSPQAKTGIEEHVKEWREWRRRWPDLDADATADGAGGGRSAIATPAGDDSA